MSTDPVVAPVLETLFAAQDRRPSHLQSIEVDSLSPFQRALLVADGTVTQLIEAYTLEAIAVVCLAQQTYCLTAADPWLELAVGDEVVDRQVVLQSQGNGLAYASAHSQIAVQRLPASIRKGLEQRDKGLGRLLIASQLETRRQLLWYGLDKNPEGPCLSRTYRVWAGGVPVMIICECFPLEHLIP